VLEPNPPAKRILNRPRQYENASTATRINKPVLAKFGDGTANGMTVDTKALREKGFGGQSIIRLIVTALDFRGEGVGDFFPDSRH